MILALALMAVPSADPALEALFADPPPPPSCSVTLTVDVTDARAGQTERQVYAYDREADAWTYVSVDGEPPAPGEREDARDEAADRILPADYYADALGRGDLDWAAVPGRPGLYRAADLPGGEIEMDGRDVSKRVMIEYAVEDAPGGPRLTNAAARLKKPWRIPFIARVDVLEIAWDYAPAGPGTGAPGAMLPIAERITFKGDVTGERHDTLIETGYSGWDCVPGEAKGP